MHVYFNGQIMPAAEVSISMDDRGFLFADALYEVVHVYRGRLFAWDYHMDRLSQGLVALAYPTVDLSALKAAADALSEEVESSQASVYIQISRGVQPRSHLFPPKSTAPTVLLWVRPLPPMAQALVDQGVEVITTPDDRWAKVWIKTVGLLPNVMAKQKAHEQGAFDAIFVRDGMVTESTSANVFIVKNGRLWTAPATNYILPGVTRRVVLELASESGLQVIQRPFGESEMAAADEVFLTGTLIEILPVRAVNGKPIAGVGPISHQLLEGLRRRT